MLIRDTQKPPPSTAAQVVHLFGGECFQRISFLFSSMRCFFVFKFHSTLFISFALVRLEHVNNATCSNMCPDSEYVRVESYALKLTHRAVYLSFRGAQHIEENSNPSLCEWRTHSRECVFRIERNEKLVLSSD